MSGNRLIETDDSDQLGRIVKQRAADRVEATKRYSDQSRERLKSNIQTKIKTTMIGSLAIIEQKIGYLWGQGKHPSQLTESEREMERVKDELRTEILNLGNNQLRAATSEINQYDVTWNRYQYTISGDGWSGPEGPDGGMTVPSNSDLKKVVGLHDDWTPKKPRYGNNEDGSIKTGPTGPEGRSS